MNINDIYSLNFGINFADYDEGNLTKIKQTRGDDPMKTKMTLVVAICFALIGGIITLSPVNVQAIPYTNPGGAGDGNEYRFYEVSHIGNTYQYEFDIHVLSTYTGNQWTDVVDSVYIMNYGPVLTNLSLVSAPNGTSNWFVSQHELNAKGFNAHASHSDSTGAGAASYYNGAGFTLGSVLSWVFQFDSTGTLDETVHVKYLYQNKNGHKVMSLGSWDYTPPPTNVPEPAAMILPTNVPEPATMLLLGLGLIGLVGARRNFKN